MITNLIVDTLASYRLTRLILEDEITSDIREAAIDKLTDSGHHKLAYLLTCPHCISVYTSAATHGLRLIAPKTAKYVNAALATAAVISVAYEKYL